MYKALEKALGQAHYTIKGGKIVVKEGEVVDVPLGNTYWVDAKVPESLEAELAKEIEHDFKNYYTVGFKNYPVEDAYLPTGQVINVEGRWN